MKRKMLMFRPNLLEELNVVFEAVDQRIISDAVLILFVGRPALKEACYNELFPGRVLF